MLNARTQEYIIIGVALAAVTFGFLNALLIMKSNITPPESVEEQEKDEEVQNIRTALSDEKLQKL